MFNRYIRRIAKIAGSVLLGLCSLEAGAQTHYSSNISFGARGGVDMSRVFFSPSVRQGFQPGMNLGVMFRYIEENHFGLIAEVDFVQRGWNEDFEETPYHYSATLNYIQILFSPTYISEENISSFSISDRRSDSFWENQGVPISIHQKWVSSKTFRPTAHIINGARMSIRK